MKIIRLMMGGAYRSCVAFIHLFDTEGGAHRSDYWGGDDTPVSRDRNLASSNRQERWRRRRRKRDNQSKID